MFERIISEFLNHVSRSLRGDSNHCDHRHLSSEVRHPHAFARDITIGTQNIEATNVHLNITWAPPNLF